MEHNEKETEEYLNEPSKNPFEAALKALVRQTKQDTKILDGIAKTEEQITKHIYDRPDSFEIGTPSKGGVVKVYFNAQDPAEALKLIENILHIRKLGEFAYEKSKVKIEEKNGD